MREETFEEIAPDLTFLWKLEWLRIFTKISLLVLSIWVHPCIQVVPRPSDFCWNKLLQTSKDNMSWSSLYFFAHHHIACWHIDFSQVFSTSERKSLCDRQWPPQRVYQYWSLSLLGNTGCIPALFSCQRENLALVPISTAMDLIYSVSLSIKMRNQTGCGHAHARKLVLPQRAHVGVYSAWVHHILAVRVRVNRRLKFKFVRT